MDLHAKMILALVLYILATDVMVLGRAYGEPLGQNEKNRCLIDRHRSKLRLTCRDLDLEYIPKTKDPGIQVLDLTHNHIKEIEPGLLSYYGSLETLYLSGNRIYEITKDMVAELQYLHELYITDNVLAKISPSLFELPYLNSLYLTYNYLEDKALTFNVTSNLVTLVVSKNKLTRIPSIGFQPHLTYLNLSMNSIGHVSTEDLAPFCSLKVLDLTKNNIKFDSSCDCHVFKSWAEIRTINVKPTFTCGEAVPDTCDSKSFSNETMETFNKCLEIIKVQQAAFKAKTTWISVGSCAVVVIICLLIGLYCVRKRNKKRDRKLKEKQRLAANNANTELLNGNLPDQLPIKTLQE